jgi:hypothetical protein
MSQGHTKRQPILAAKQGICFNIIDFLNFVSENNLVYDDEDNNEEFSWTQSRWQAEICYVSFFSPLIQVDRKKRVAKFAVLWEESQIVAYVGFWV